MGQPRPRDGSSARGDAEADACRDQRLRARGRLRASARVRPPVRVGARKARTAGDQPRHRSRLGRYAAAGARLRCRRGEGADLHRTRRGRGRGAAHRPRAGDRRPGARPRARDRAIALGEKQGRVADREEPRQQSTRRPGGGGTGVRRAVRGSGCQGRSGGLRREPAAQLLHRPGGEGVCRPAR